MANVHSNVKYAEQTRFKQRLVQGSPTYSIVTGLIKALNQDGVVVQRSEWSLLMLRRRGDVEALVAASIPTEAESRKE